MADYITIVANSAIKDLSGTVIANGEFSIMATDDKDNPIPVRIGSSTAQALNQPVRRGVSSGSLSSSIQVPNPATTDPSPIYFRITVKDLDQNKITVYRKVQITDSGDGTWNFASMQTGLSVGAVVSYVVGPKGDKGDAGSSGIDSPKSLALLSQVQPTSTLQNLFNAAAAQVGYINGSDGSFVYLSGYSASDFMPANAGGQMTTAQALYKNTSAAVAFYDQNKVFISQLSTGVAAGGTFSCPTNAYFTRTTQQNGFFDLPTQMIVFGASLPASYQAFGTYAKNDIDAKVATATASVGSQITTAQNDRRYVDAQLRNKMFPGINYFDSTAATPGYIKAADGTIVAASGYVTSDYIPVNAGGQMVLNTPMIIGASAPCYFDENYAFISSDYNEAYRTAGTPMTAAPRIAAYVRFTVSSAYAAVAVFQYGTVASSTYLPFGFIVPPMTQISQSAVSPLKGKKIAIWGDSISSIFANAWQNVLTTRGGCTVQFQDARPGRLMGQIFECYGNSPTGTNLGVISTPYGNYQNTGTVGNTLAQDIAACDIGIIFLGTNNFGSADGAYGDPSTAATNYGWVKFAIEGVLTAAPGMRLVMVTNQMRTSETIARAEALANIWETVARDYAVPVLNLTKVGGCNLITASTLLADGLHPSTLGFSKFVGPLIAQFVQQYA